MRVVGGESRGRKLTAAVGEGVRPTSDRVKESIFDILGSITSLIDTSVVDLFAGTGALGIEALSRGASSAMFVERDANAAVAIKANLVAVGLDGPKVQVIRRDVMDFLEALARRERSEPFGLALCDPPYGYEEWPRLLELLPAQIAVLESDGEVPVPERWMVIRSRRYGGTLVTVVRARDDREGGPE
jgi:16S rRNA (guanine966-N2)-methyltransferase